jgi:hypothetical protein
MILHPEWKTALARHWSAWVYYIIAALALIPEGLGFIGQDVELPPYLYLALAVVGLGAKVVKQELPPKEETDVKS